MSIFSFVMCLEAHYICMVKHEFQHTGLVSLHGAHPTEKIPFSNWL